MTAPVSICLIVKNEEKNIERCLQSIRPHVAEICVVDTGSSDKTPEIVQKYADKFEVYTDCNDPQTGLIEDFSQARNRSFELATQPWLMWIDGDDEVQNADKIESIITEQGVHRETPLMVMFPYEYSHDDKGNVTCLHWRERLVTPKAAFKWKGPVHEILNPEIPGTAIIRKEDTRIIHRRNQVGKVIESGRNLRILKKYYNKVGESDVRQLYYLGLEYGNNGDIGNSIRFHKRYVELSGWDDEKFLACLKITEHYQGIGQYEDAIEWALKALTVREGWSEAYFALGKSYYFMAQRGGPDERRHWERAIHFMQLGLKLPPTETILFINPLERQYEIHKFLNFALNKVGRVHEAMGSVDQALKIRPDDEGLKGNRKLYQEFIAKISISDSLNILVEVGKLNKNTRDLIDNLIEGKASVDVARKPEEARQSQIIESGKFGLDIIFFVGFSAEPWNPNTMARGGIGGSETAIVEMGKRLVAKGHKVRVFGDCPDPSLEGLFDGVQYLHYDKYKNTECDVLITSRRPHAIDDEHNVKWKIALCWVHDIHCGPALTHTRALRIDKFLTLSQWHKSFFLDSHKFIHPDQVIVTRNGIDLTRFDQDVPRNPHKAVYSSSPDRGLEVAIKVWPIIRERVPDAELHVFYGFKTWEISAQGNQEQKNLIAHLKGMLEATKNDGVIYRDRIDQNELAREFLSSGVWAYPTWFAETSCITAMEAQAAGLRIITSPIAALNETVGNRGVMIPGDWLTNEYQAGFINSVVDAMTKDGDDDRKQLQAFARRNFGWDSLADEWDTMLRDVMGEVMINVVPPYKAAF